MGRVVHCHHLVLEAEKCTGKHAKLIRIYKFYEALCETYLALFGLMTRLIPFMCGMPFNV